MKAMRIYVDTSVVIGVYFREKEYQRMRTTLSEAADVLSSSLLVAEMASTFKREEIDMVFLEPCVQSISIYYPNASLLPYYKKILTQGYCRGANLFHLACAMQLDPEVKELSFATHDSQQKKLAEKLGFRVI